MRTFIGVLAAAGVALLAWVGGRCAAATRSRPPSNTVRSMGYDGERLILTTCHPVYSASHRLVVKAVRAKRQRA
jgi:hypothetical protein